MHRRWIWLTGLIAAATVPLVAAQQTCPNGVQIEGTVTDPTGAAIPGAQVQTTRGERTVSDAIGRYVLPCVPASSSTISVKAEGFTTGTAQAHAHAGETAHVNVQLSLASVQTEVHVGDDTTAMDADHGVNTLTLNTRDVRQLADDPDDFLRELQSLASIGGGLPGAAIITVDGFQNTSALPPKDSIASIRINPDMFSGEYERAPYLGGRVKIFTKPGVDTFHGALFFTDSDGSFNATDPFSLTSTPAGKRRYGFELSGPIVPKKSDFALTLEKRDIDEYNVVNAVTLNNSDTPSTLQETVSAPQRLWIASARGDWQATPADVATLSFSANVNNLGNEGVGGLTLVNAGYSSLVLEDDLRLINVQTFGANLLHETHIGYSWNRTEDTPNSTEPALQVAGYFTGGSSTSQNLNDRERDLEIDDDITVTHGKHSMMFGAQSLGVFVHDYDPNTFNGSYVFGGGSAPVLDASNNPTSETTTISGIEQYQRALLGLAGGNPTTYQQTTGTPLVPLTQWRLALYGQDSIKVAPRFTFMGALRYQLQTTPGSFANFSPRVGISWAPDKKESWVFHLRAGIFHDPNIQAYATDVYRLNGQRQQETTIYSPSYGSPLTPIPGSIQVGTVEQFPHTLQQVSSLQTHISVEHNFPHHWHAASTLYWAENWRALRIKNINAPLVSSGPASPSPTAALQAPRPIEPNENILQYQNSGHLSGNIFVTGADRSSDKNISLSAYYVHVNLKTDAGESSVISPQSSYSEQGEASRADGEPINAIYASGSVHFPYKIEFSAIMDAESGEPYNIITGTDANGDGDFNDRPSYADTTGPGVYSTRFGLLTTSVVNGDVPRNRGTLPSRIHLDSNLSRSFVLNPRDKNHRRTLTLNARSANLLNHTNVTSVGTVLPATTFGQALTAETARRVELGIRFAF